MQVLWTLLLTCHKKLRRASYSGTLYIGGTNDLVRRVYKHRHKLIGGYTTKYNISKLVYYEVTGDITSAISREKQSKGWLRSKKVTEKPAHGVNYSIFILHGAPIHWGVADFYELRTLDSGLQTLLR